MINTTSLYGQPSSTMVTLPPMSQILAISPNPAPALTSNGLSMPSDVIHTTPINIGVQIMPWPLFSEKMTSKPRSVSSAETLQEEAALLFPVWQPSAAVLQKAPLPLPKLVQSVELAPQPVYAPTNLPFPTMQDKEEIKEGAFFDQEIYNAAFMNNQNQQEGTEVQQFAAL